MGQDLRELFEAQREESKDLSMREGHEARFEDRLLRRRNNRPKPGLGSWWKLAAVAAVIVATFFGWRFSQQESIQEQVIPKDEVVSQENFNSEAGNTYTLGDISPDLQKVEAFYQNQINYQLSQLPLHEDQGDVVDQYLERLAELDRDYKELNKELFQQGPNDQLIGALIQNLQLRLELISKLQKKLNQLKSSENEQVSTITI